MNDKKFKVGDRVRIINSNSIEFCELNKVGTIVDIQDCSESSTYVVDMGRQRRPNNPWEDETCWYLYENSIELVIKQNEQLVFNFMLD